MKKLLCLPLIAVLTVPAWSASKTVTLSIPTMDCPVCPITIKKALGKVEGVVKAEVNFDKRQAIVTFDDAKVGIESLTHATRNAGYPSTVAGSPK